MILYVESCEHNVNAADLYMGGVLIRRELCYNDLVEAIAGQVAPLCREPLRLEYDNE